jgi:hypothetical protein
MKRREKLYRAARVRNTSALWRLLERREGKKGGTYYVCIAIGNPKLKEIARQLN